MTLGSGFLPAIIERFKAYRELGDKTLEQLTADDLVYQPSSESNSIAVIVQHFYGNAMRRWTNFLTEDGKKPWRERDAEFEPALRSREDALSLWTSRWTLVFDTLENLNEDDPTKTIYIRSEPILVFDALLRHLAHYSLHIGQMIYFGKLIKNTARQSLSIPRHPAKLNNPRPSL